MTAWQDQPPISRRQVRQNERDDAVDTQIGHAQIPSGDTADEAADKPQFEGFPREGWSGEARRSSGEGDDQNSQATTRAGRRAQATTAQSAAVQSSDGAAPEPLTYVTQVRPQVPSYDGPSFRNRSISAVPDLPAGSDTPPESADSSNADAPKPSADKPAYRVRDFSPEGRRSTFTSTATSRAASAGGELDYHTVGAHVPTPTSAEPDGSAATDKAATDQNAADQAAADQNDKIESPVIERTMTRREMRALEQAGILPPLEPARDSASPDRARPDIPRLRARIRHTGTDTDEIRTSELEAALAEYDALAAEDAGNGTTAVDAEAAAQPEAVVEAEVVAEPEAAAANKPEVSTVYVVSSTDSVESAEEAEVVIATTDVDSADVDSADADIDDELDNEDTASTVFPLVEPGPFGFAIPPENAPEPTNPAPSAFAPRTRAFDQPKPAAEATAASVAPPLTDSVPVFEAAPRDFRFEELLFQEPQTEPKPESETAEQTAEKTESKTDEAAPATTPAPVTPAPVTPSTPVTPETYTPPVGHWSTQALIDDDEQFQENTLSRNIGSTSGAITTSSIVMPSIPSADDILSPLGSTGEILITGTINLPSSMGNTGALPARYDHSDVDALLAADDREDAPNTDSAPIRAIRAVSTHTSSGAVIATGKPAGGTKLPLIAAISAGGVVVVGAIALTIAAFVTGIF